MYNEWFVEFAPAAYRATRQETASQVEAALAASSGLKRIDTALLRRQPEILPVLRMSTCPPLAVDRLIGLAGVSSNLVKTMERGKLPPRMAAEDVDDHLGRIAETVMRMVDPDIFVWLEGARQASEKELFRATTVVADRLCGAIASPIVRNAQEKRQLAAIAGWLDEKGYQRAEISTTVRQMQPGSYAFRMSVPVEQRGSERSVNIPVDVVAMPRKRRAGRMPILLEAKSAGDYANVNERRKEEAAKNSQLRETYGERASLVMFLCGYFDSGYLGYEAAEGIDWIWEHRIDDLAKLGL